MTARRPGRLGWVTTRVLRAIARSSGQVNAKMLLVYAGSWSQLVTSLTVLEGRFLIRPSQDRVHVHATARGRLLLGAAAYRDWGTLPVVDVRASW